MVSAGPLVGIGFGNPFVVVSRKAVDQTPMKAKDPDFGCACWRHPPNEVP